MWRQIQTAVSLIYPPRCLGCGEMVQSDFGLCGTCWRDTPFIGGTVCEGCGAPLPGQGDRFRAECDDCMSHPRPWSQGRSALLYQDCARKIVLALKHGDRLDIAEPAAHWMHHAAGPMLRGDPLIAPVPLHWTRMLKRRYNQSALLAQALARIGGVRCCPDLLCRSSRTPSLDGKSRADRFAVLGNSINAHPRRLHHMQDRVVLLVDDVMTSGATLTACADACLGSGATEVRVIALARVIMG